MTRVLSIIILRRRSRTNKLHNASCLKWVLDSATPLARYLLVPDLLIRTFVGRRLQNYFVHRSYRNVEIISQSGTRTKHRSTDENEASTYMYRELCLRVPT